MDNICDLTWDEVQNRAESLAEHIKHNLMRTHTVKLFGIPRGGIPACLMVARALARVEVEAQVVEAAAQADVFIDDIIDSGETKRTVLQLYPTTPFCALVEKGKEDKFWYRFPWERMSKKKTDTEETVQENIKRILQYLGEDQDREGLKDTPSRVVRSWDKLYGGYNIKPTGILTTFEEPCDEMVVLKDIEFYSTCEHHMLPFFGKAHIGYLPSNKVVGISKLARLLEIFARRLQIQERIGQQVTSTLIEHLCPLGCGCVLEAQHFCMTSRGIEKQNSIMVTSSMQGCFRTSSDVRSEFLRMIGK